MDPCQKRASLRKRVYRIEICGGIASGKTTFLGLLSKVGCQTVYESFATNPFWEAFYTDPSKYAFETEISFTLQHYHQIKKQSQISGLLACDYSFILDKAYAELGLQGSQLSAFNTVYAEIQKELPHPTLLIHLQCDAEIEFARIRARGRDIEKNITVDFLSALNEAVSVQVEKAKGNTPILTIDSAKNNFVEDEDVKRKLLQMVVEALPTM